MNESYQHRPILILGIGNILLRDEGVGVRVVEYLQQKTLRNEIEVVDGGTAGADLIDIIADRKKVIIVDAVEAQKAPATILRFDESDLEDIPVTTLSLHDLGIYGTLKMSEKLNCRPEEVIFFGIQPYDISPGLELSKEIAENIPLIAEKVLEEAFIN